MGFFGRLVYSDGIWGDDAHGDEYLAIDVHDSDIATVDYRPATGQGRFYLGYQPREYFEDPDASEPIDVDTEAAHFATWAQQVLRIELTAAQVRPLLADSGDAEPPDAFVEQTVEHLVNLLGLPMPEELRGTADP